MDRPPDAEQTGGAETRFSRQIDPAIPSKQPGFMVTTSEWERLKTRIRGISSWESLWLAAMSSSFTGAISFGIGAATLTQRDDAPVPLLVGFFGIAFLGFGAAVSCLFGYVQSRAHRKSDIDCAIEHMEDIERIYFPAEHRR